MHFESKWCVFCAQCWLCRYINPIGVSETLWNSWNFPKHRVWKDCFSETASSLPRSLTSSQLLSQRCTLQMPEISTPLYIALQLCLNPYPEHASTRTRFKPEIEMSTNFGTNRLLDDIGVLPILLQKGIFRSSWTSRCQHRIYTNVWHLTKKKFYRFNDISCRSTIFHARSFQPPPRTDDPSCWLIFKIVFQILLGGDTFRVGTILRNMAIVTEDMWICIDSCKKRNSFLWFSLGAILRNNDFQRRHLILPWSFEDNIQKSEISFRIYSERCALLLAQEVAVLVDALAR